MGSYVQLSKTKEKKTVVCLDCLILIRICVYEGNLQRPFRLSSQDDSNQDCFEAMCWLGVT